MAPAALEVVRVHSGIGLVGVLSVSIAVSPLPISVFVPVIIVSWVMDGAIFGNFVVKSAVKTVILVLLMVAFFSMSR